MIYHIKGSLKNKDQTIQYDTKGIWNPTLETLTWKEEDALHTTNILDLKNGKLCRNNKELKMILTFAEKEDKILNCKLSSILHPLIIKVHILKLKQEKNYLFLMYETSLKEEKLDSITLEINFSEWKNEKQMLEDI